MSNAPVTHIDPVAFRADPYPVLAHMRAHAPVTYVPELGATLFTRRDDIFTQEKRIGIFSSLQPDGLMTKLMGENLMRKDGDDHQAERRALFPALSPRTVRDHWLAAFQRATMQIIQTIKPDGHGDLVRAYAMPVSAEALKEITGLRSMPAPEMDRVSQGMIDGCANYAGDPVIEAHCHDCTASIDTHIDAMIPVVTASPDHSALYVMLRAGLPMDSIRANIKLIISGGQNEPRDAIAGTVWALLSQPDQLALIRSGQATWAQAFDEYARWISPIGMSPRRVAHADTVGDVTFQPQDRVFFMFSSAGRDEAHFTAPDRFDITRNTGPAISFGAGPHFCAGAAAARALIADVALPLIFAHLPGLALDGPAPFAGWAFRGPLSVPVRWET
ncbi:cytochrome P450 [Seohaeicola saemankumensis]|uniref:cytochrome P450 n=1 Tax=Seohaeicola saemankumensis TaxID=481181 RepID=UPI001E351D94|nr:cytochrome P450 [Seohaeicola saemankumensis]MCD1627919.1 cytochrome P450 [Seohaeicola saemankumensis]